MKPYQFVLLFLICFSLKANAIQRDTTYKRGDFLIDVSDKTNIDLIQKGTPLQNRTSKGDTLFENKKYVVLGDDTNITVIGIYKKFHTRYKFSDYSTHVYKGRLAQPNFKTDTAAYFFRTQIRTQCKEAGINFAGHYTIVMWGCGSPCQQVAVVDRINGRIYYSNIPQINNELAFELMYKPNSDIIILNSDLLEEHKGYVNCSSLANLEILEWKNNKVRRLPE
jgi:hypothetical protein